MNPASAPDRFTSRQHRGIYLVGYLLIFGVALRRYGELDGAFGIGLYSIFLALFVVLYSVQPFISKRFPRYQWIYFAVQFFLAQVMAIFEVYLDNWAFLYITLAVQATAICSRKEALAWGSLFTASIVGTLCFEFGPLSGLGLAMVYILIGVLVISYDMQYSQQEDAQAESQVLLEELQAAHQKLKAQAAQAERLAGVQERNRMAHEIHDSVGQKVFAIQLMAASTGLLLEKDPARVPPNHLELLQEQTQSALREMRELIARWR